MSERRWLPSESHRLVEWAPITAWRKPAAWKGMVGALGLSWGLLLSIAEGGDGGGSIVDRLPDMEIEDLLQLEVVTASKTAEKAAEAPASVTVVTAEEIRMQGYRTLGEVLRSLPGLWTSWDGSYEHLGVRGLNLQDYNARVLVLIDGVRLNENTFDSAYIDRTFFVDPEAIERIEFVAGPSSALHGNNALLGVVTVITKTGRDSSVAKVRIEIAADQTWRAAVQERAGEADARNLIFPPLSDSGHSALPCQLAAIMRPHQPHSAALPPSGPASPGFFRRLNPADRATSLGRRPPPATLPPPSRFRRPQIALVVPPSPPGPAVIASLGPRSC